MLMLTILRWWTYADRCTQLEGDEAYRCWEALFEFENIKVFSCCPESFPCAENFNTDIYSLELLEIAPSSQDNPILAFWIGERLNIRCTMLCHSTLDSIGSAVVRCNACVLNKEQILKTCCSLEGPLYNREVDGSKMESLTKGAFSLSTLELST